MGILFFTLIGLVGVFLGVLLSKLIPAAEMRGDFAQKKQGIDFFDDKDLRHMVTSDPLYRIDGGFL